MKRLPMIFSLPALILVAACTDERGEGAANSNDNMATDDGTMMAPAEMPTTNGNGVPSAHGIPSADGTMGTDGTATGATGTVGSTGNTGGNQNNSRTPGQ